MQTTKIDGPGNQSAWQGLERSRDTNQPTMTTIIQRELEDFDQRTPRRARVVGRLIFLQAALLLMVTPIVVWPTLQPVGIAIIGVGFLTYGIAWLRNISGQVQQAQKILIVGSGVVTAANMLGQIIWHPAEIIPIGLSSLPFLLTILEAGLLFLPEIALLTAVATTGVTVLGLLAVVALHSDTLDKNTYQVYLVAVMALGLQALTGIVAWQISYFIMDFSTELSKVRREEFISTQYDALRRSIDEQAARLREQSLQIVNSIVSLTSRDYTARVNLPDGDLKPIADTLNLLASQLGSVAESDQLQVNILNDAAQITDLAGQIAQGEGPFAGNLSQPALPTTATGGLLQSAVVAMYKARNSTQQRLLQVRDLAFDAGQRLNQAEERTLTVESHISENLATIGLLRAEADRLYGSASRLNQLIDDALRSLSGLVPPEVSAQARIESHDAHTAAALQQVMPGVTIQLEAITEETQLGNEDFGLRPSSATPLTPTGSATPLMSDPNAQLKLRETWSGLVEMTEEVAKQVRDAQVLQDKLGVTSKSMRQVDNDLIQLRGVVAVVRQLAEQLFHTSSATTHSLNMPVQPDSVSPSLPRPAAPTQTPLPPSHINAADLIDPMGTQPGSFTPQLGGDRPSNG